MRRLLTGTLGLSLKCTLRSSPPVLLVSVLPSGDPMKHLSQNDRQGVKAASVRLTQLSWRERRSLSQCLHETNLKTPHGIMSVSLKPDSSATLRQTGIYLIFSWRRCERSVHHQKTQRTTNLATSTTYASILNLENIRSLRGQPLTEHTCCSCGCWVRMRATA